MKNMKFWRTALVATLVLTVMLSVTGGTIAWFTDSVESGSNIIKAGNLDVEMYWADGTKAVPAADSQDWKDAADANVAIFNYVLWEPGYTEVRHVKIENKGTLALKYDLKLVPTGEVSKLADVIDVYYTDPAKQVSNRTDLTEDNKIGNLTQFVAQNATADNSAAGHLLAGKSHTVTLALKMQESAGNEYQDLSIGSSFKLVLEATQYTYEEDSFNDQYDANAVYPSQWDGTVDTSWYNDTDTSFTLTEPAQLAGLSALAAEGKTFSGKTIELDSDFDLMGREWTPVKKFSGTLDGNGHTISHMEIDATSSRAGFFTALEWAKIKDLTLTDIEATVGDRFGTLTYSVNQTTIENVTVKNVTIITTSAQSMAAGLFCAGTVNSTETVNNCTVEYITVDARNGAALIGGIATFVQKNGTEAEGTNIFDNLQVKNFKVIVKDTDGQCGVGGIFAQTQSVWQNPHFKNCAVSGFDVGATGTVDVGGFICYPGSWTYATDCTVEGKIDASNVTSEKNYVGGFFGDYGWGDNVGKGDHMVTRCTADVDIMTKVAAAGGFVGSGTNSEGRNKNITFTDCDAKGAVTLAEGGTANIGGFVGKTDRGIYVNCSAAQTPFIGAVIDGYTLNDDGNGTLTVTKNN